MTEEDLFILAYGTVVLGLIALVTLVCAFIAYRAIRSFITVANAFSRRSKFKVLEGGKNKPVDPTRKLGYTGEHERDRKGP